MKADIGVVGLAVMGQNLALNIESKGYTTAVFNRTGERTKEFVATRTKGKEIVPGYSIEEFVLSLQPPRRIIIMVKAGEPVDSMIDQIAPHLEKGDILIDAGNSFFQDTNRRLLAAEQKGFLYIGTGVSGGEEGALHGPSIMPGGHPEAYQAVKKVLRDIAAKAADGEPCCTYIGKGGAGHYVKMVHNGIEYGDMQLISESYLLMKNVLGLTHQEMHEIFSKWNEGELNSYLIQITADILSKTDPDTGDPLVEVILDKAGQKGTGKWTSQSALDLGVAAPTIAEAVFARCISAVKDERVEASRAIKGPTGQFNNYFRGSKRTFIEAIRKALYASKICSYAQGFALMKEAAKENGWDLQMGEISMIWRAGCIIRARFLEKIKDAFNGNPRLANLLMDPYFQDIAASSQKEWRDVVITATNLGVPVPGFSSALMYFDSYRNSRLSANMIQAQRDYFGAHTYERIDKPGSFHTEWSKA